MNEIDKLYSNAGVETNTYKLCCTGCKHIAKLEVINGFPTEWFCDKYDELANCDRAEPQYPQFTPSKQLEVIKVLAESRPIHINFYIDKWVIESFVLYGKQYDTFEGALSGYINQLWKYLSPEEQEKIRRILEE